MPANLLLMCKILAVALLFTGHVRILPDPFLPFIHGLDRIVEPQVFRRALQATFLLSALALLFNRWVRVSALVLGGCLLLAVVSSRAYYGNNKTFCGLALVLAGLSDFDRPPLLLRWQLVLVYFGAALNKLLDADWRSGVFFDHWAGERLQNPVYIAAAVALPALVAGKIMCWGTILAEFTASLGLVIPRCVVLALWANVLFQFGLLQFTGTTFVLFFYGMQAIILAFVIWPLRLDVHYDDERSGHAFVRHVMGWLDPDRIQDWRPLAGPLQVVDGARAYCGFAAVRRLLLFSPVFWLTATALLAAIDTPWWRRVLVAAILILFLPLGLRARR